MNVKKYLANDMAEAMADIRRELGSDAIILSRRNVRAKGILGLFKKPILEVVVAYDKPNPLNLNRPKPAQSVPEAREEAREKGAEGRVAKKGFSIMVGDESKAEAKDLRLDEIEEPSEEDKYQKLLEEIDSLRGIFTDFSHNVVALKDDRFRELDQSISKFYKNLIDSDVEEDIARELLFEVKEVASKVEDSPASILHQLIKEKIGECSPIKLKKFRRTIIMLIGPTGVGKTTTLVKLSGKFIAEEGLKVGLINTDTYRIGAHDQIRTYADIMQVPLNIVYTPEEVEEALKEQEDRDVILIDTAGKNSWDEEYKKDLKGIIEAAKPDEIMLLLSVNSSRQAIRGILENYSFIEDYKLIITKSDEIKVWGNMLNIVERSGKEIAYLTNGQSVPDDIEVADLDKIVSNIFGNGDIHE